MAKTQNKNQNIIELVFLSFVLIISFLFWDSFLVYPIKLFVVLIHEISHAISAILSGGKVIEFTSSTNTILRELLIDCVDSHIMKYLPSLTSLNCTNQGYHPIAVLTNLRHLKLWNRSDCLHAGLIPGMRFSDLNLRSLTLRHVYYIINLSIFPTTLTDLVILSSMFDVYGCNVDNKSLISFRTDMVNPVVKRIHKVVNNNISLAKMCLRLVVGSIHDAEN